MKQLVGPKMCVSWDSGKSLQNCFLAFVSVVLQHTALALLAQGGFCYEKKLNGWIG